MSQLIASAELAEAAVQALIDKIAQLDGKVVTIAVNTVGNAGDSGVGGIATQAEAAAGAVRDLAVIWTEEEAAQSAADAGARMFGRDVAASMARAEDATHAYTQALIDNLEYDRYVINNSAEQWAVGLAKVADAYRNVYDAQEPMERSLGELRDGINATNEAVDFEAQVMQAKLGPGFLIAASNAHVASDAMREAASAVSASGNAAGTAWGPWWFFGNNFRTVAHWIVAGSAEFLAVAIPAAIALGAGVAVAAQGAQNAYEHFTALYDATESTANAMHTTVGDVLGLGNALQTAQNAANPGVYEILGSAINDAKSGFSSLATTGLQVVHMFDEFAARVTVDLREGLGTEVQSLLSGMVHDLQEFGQVLGNLGHALLNFAADMPGLVHILLTLATYLSSVIELASHGGAFITLAMAIEETYRWGGLLLGLMARLAGAGGMMTAFADGGGFITKFGAAIKALVAQGGIAIIWVGQMIGKLSGLVPAAEEAGAAVETFGADVAIAGAEMDTNWIAAIAAAVVVLGFLAYKLTSVKSATDQFVASTDQAVQSASDLQVFNTIAKTMAENAVHMSAAQQQSTTATNQFNAAAEHGKYATAGYAGAAMQAEGAVQKLSQQQTYLIGTAATVGTNLGLLSSHFHTTAIGALALANAAGVNLQIPLTNSGMAAKIAEQQITNLKTGLGAMAAPAGVIGADMEAIGVQSQLASSKVGQVNQAMDAFIAGTTGGMNSVMQFNAGLQAMGKDTVAGSQSISGAINTISKSAAAMGYTLQGFGPKAQQSWQQFDGAVQQGNTVLDTMRTGMAENVVSWGQYNNEVKAVGGSLLPFAAHNKAALSIVSQFAQEIGDPATHNLRTLASDFGITGKAAQNMATVGMEQAIAKMANLSQVARNLSATVSSQLTGAMASAITKFSGMNSAVNKYAQDLGNANTPSSILHADLQKISDAASNEYRMISDASRGISDATKNTDLMKGAAEGAAGAIKGAGDSVDSFTGKLQNTHAALGDVVARAGEAANATQGLSSQTRTAATSASGLSTQTGQATTQVRNLGSAASVTQAHVGDVNNEIRTAATAAGNAQGPLGGMTGQIRNVGSAASTAAGEVHALATAMAGLQSKTVTLTTNMVTVTSTIHRQHGGPVFPGVPYTVGEAGEELFVPSQAGVILPHDQTAQLIGAPQAAAGPPAGGFGNQGTSEVHSHISVNLDGRQLWKGIQTQMLQWQIRNSGRATGLTVPQPPGKLT